VLRSLSVACSNDAGQIKQTPTSELNLLSLVCASKARPLLLLDLLLATFVLELNTSPKTINSQFTMSRRVNAATDAAKEVTASPRTSRQT
jgi:hypothetical protein